MEAENVRHAGTKRGRIRATLRNQTPLDVNTAYGIGRGRGKACHWMSSACLCSRFVDIGETFVPTYGPNV